MTATGPCRTTASARRPNSRSFLLRLYGVEADWETAAADGQVAIEDWITLSDPPPRAVRIVNERTRDRLLTGGDFDIESVRTTAAATCGSATSSAPTCCTPTAAAACRKRRSRCPGSARPTPRQPGTPNLARSNGFEGMAISKDGRTLYPVLEGPVAGDDTLVRRVYEFDLTDATGRAGASTASRGPIT